MGYHYVNCIYCGQRFNRDKEPTVQVSERRYAHKECADKRTKEEIEDEESFQKLAEYIMKKFNEPFVSPRIQKQIKEYHKTYNYSYSGMLKTLIYWYEIKGNKIDNANNGIGIIPWQYAEACRYYYNLYIIRLANEKKDIEKYRPKEKIVKIFTPESKPIKKIKLFNLDEE